MPEVATKTLNLTVTDVSKQKRASVGSVPIDTTVADLIRQIVPQAGLPRNDSEGNPLLYNARRDRGGLQLRGDELIAEIFKESDEVTLMPNIEAGLVARSGS